MNIQTWICDTCGKTIQKAEDGWIEWWVLLNEESSAGKGLRLVHHKTASPYGGSCQYDENSEIRNQGFSEYTRPLNWCLGVDGLMLLLSDLADGDLPKEEVLELIKRLHIPGYEHARLHFESAISAGVIERKDPAGYYCQDEIEAVLRFSAQ